MIDTIDNGAKTLVSKGKLTEKQWDLLLLKYRWWNQMTEEIRKIIKKLPADLQKEFEKDYAIHPKWSPNWDKWGKETLYQLDLCRDNNIISKEEWQIIYDDIYAGRIGCLSLKTDKITLRALEYLFYDPKEDEEK